MIAILSVQRSGPVSALVKTNATTGPCIEVGLSYLFDRKEWSDLCLRTWGQRADTRREDWEQYVQSLLDACDNRKETFPNRVRRR